MGRRLHGPEGLAAWENVGRGMDVRPRRQCWCGGSHWMNGLEGGEVRTRGTMSEFLVSEEILFRGRCG